MMELSDKGEKCAAPMSLLEDFTERVIWLGVGSKHGINNNSEEHDKDVRRKK